MCFLFKFFFALLFCTAHLQKEMAVVSCVMWKQCWWRGLKEGVRCWWLLTEQHQKRFSWEILIIWFSYPFARFHLKSHDLFHFLFCLYFQFFYQRFALTAPMQCSRLAGCRDACMYAQHFGGWGRRILSSRPAWAPYWSSISQSSHFLSGDVCCTKMNANFFYLKRKHISINLKKKCPSAL